MWVRKRKEMNAKFPRMYHLPWSPGVSRDDKVLRDVGRFLHKPLVITEKLDGSNICFTRDQVFARSHSGTPTHPSFAQAKSYHASIKHKIGAGVSIFLENMFAVHSIRYNALTKSLFVIGVRDDNLGVWLGWSDTELIAHPLGLPTVPLLGRAYVKSPLEFQELTQSLGKDVSRFGPNREGVVVRWEDNFACDNFDIAVAKWVRKGHVTTDQHWRNRKIEKQKIAA